MFTKHSYPPERHKLAHSQHLLDLISYGPAVWAHLRQLNATTGRMNMVHRRAPQNLPLIAMCVRTKHKKNRSPHIRSRLYRCRDAENQNKKKKQAKQFLALQKPWRRIHWHTFKWPQTEKNCNIAPYACSTSFAQMQTLLCCGPLRFAWCISHSFSRKTRRQTGDRGSYWSSVSVWGFWCAEYAKR